MNYKTMLRKSDTCAARFAMNCQAIQKSSAGVGNTVPPDAVLLSVAGQVCARCRCPTSRWRFMTANPREPCNRMDEYILHPAMGNRSGGLGAIAMARLLVRKTE